MVAYDTTPPGASIRTVLFDFVGKFLAFLTGLPGAVRALFLAADRGQL